MTARLQRLQVMLTDAELEEIDNWRFENRMPTRAAAVRELLRRGLTAGNVGLVSGEPANQVRRRTVRR